MDGTLWNTICVEPMKVQRRVTRDEVKKLLAARCVSFSLCFVPVQIPEPRFDTSKLEIAVLNEC